MNTHDEILYGGDCIRYRCIFMTSRDRVGYNTSDPLNRIINYTFNFDNVFKVALKSFTWVSCQASTNNSFNAYIKSVALTQYDTTFQNSSRLGPNIFEIIPMGDTTNNVPGNVNYYEPINLHWHKFAPSNTINQIDFELLGINGNEWVIDPTVPDAGNWDMQIILAEHVSGGAKLKQDYSILNWN